MSDLVSYHTVTDKQIELTVQSRPLDRTQISYRLIYQYVRHSLAQQGN